MVIKAQLLGHERAELPGEYHLLLAVIQQAQRDANYVPRSGTRHREVSEIEQAEAQQFLAWLRGESTSVVLHQLLPLVKHRNNSS